MSRESMDVATASRTNDLLTLARLSVGRDPVHTILDWLGRRSGGPVLLVGPGGKVLARSANHPAPAPGVLRTVGAAVAELPERGADSAVLNADGPATIHVLRLARPVPDRQAASLVARTDEQLAYLVVIADPAQQYGELFADTARTLSLCWRIEEADRIRQRIVAADAHGREAVLHLLMVGDVPPARRIASALRPHLPDALRVCVVECVGRQRYEVAAELDRSLTGRAWVVPCPVRSNHLIALVPAESPGDATGRADPADRLGRLITARVRRCRVGMSEPVALSDAAIGYEQAFHALAVARATAEGYARFDRQHDLVPLTGTAGYVWAQRLLQPCLGYTPARRADPGAAELLGTLASWLTFDSGASRHLKIHRNTLAGRLRLLNALLGLDLLRVRDRSAAWLALRLSGTTQRGTSGGGTAGDGDAGVVTLDQLLAAPPVAAWARARLRPLQRADRSTALETVRTWLNADTNLSATAGALGISLSATRKRLGRAEQALDRSLLHAPDARHELWLAIRAVDLTARPEPST